MSKNHHTQKSKIDFTAVISLGMILITTLGTTIPLYMHISSSTNEHLQGIREEIRCIQTEMKDFHGRLCAIEERNKKG